MRRRRIAQFAAVFLALAWARQASAQLFILREFQVGTAVPDGGELSQAASLAFGNGTISSVRVSLEISGTPGFTGDLYATLGHDAGYSVLLNRPGKRTPEGAGYADSGLNVTFADDAANGDIHVYRETLFGNDGTALAAPLTGLWAPDGRGTDPDAVLASDPRTSLLGSFAGLRTDGEWRLLVADLSTGAAHRLESWSLEIETPGDFTGTLSLDGEAIRSGAAPVLVTAPVQLSGSITSTGLSPITFAGPATIQNDATLAIDNTLVLSGGLSGAGTLAKTGTGTLVLAGPGTQTGGTIVEQGALLLQNTAGSATGSGQISVRNSAILGGNGSSSGTALFETGAVLAPGDGVGALTLGGVIFEAGSHYRFEMNQASSAQGSDPGWDWLNVAGSIVFSATSNDPFVLELYTLKLDNSPGPVHDLSPDGRYSWTIATAAGGIFNFDPAAVSINSSEFLNVYPDAKFALQVSGNNLQLTLVPEPGTYAVVSAVSLLLFAIYRHRRA